ncbi:MAG TPA: response regulator [Polyangiaceae bacterium]
MAQTPALCGRLARPFQTAMSRGMVLVVDDDPVVLEVTRERLEGVGYAVHTRQEAIGTSQWASEFQPDVILLDINMPALDGTDLAQLLKRRRATKNLAIILFSSMDSQQLDRRLSDTGADGAIQKTGDAARFLSEFESLIARWRTQPQLH